MAQVKFWSHWLSKFETIRSKLMVFNCFWLIWAPEISLELILTQLGLIGLICAQMHFLVFKLAHWFSFRLIGLELSWKGKFGSKSDYLYCIQSSSLIFTSWLETVNCDSKTYTVIQMNSLCFRKLAGAQFGFKTSKGIEYRSLVHWQKENSKGLNLDSKQLQTNNFNNVYKKN